MKALSVKQPWAFLLVDGQKQIEVRSWSTDYRGELIICASAAPKNVFWHDYHEKQNRLLPAGCVIGAVELLDVRKLEPDDSEYSLCEYQPDCYAWVMNSVCFFQPKKILGKLSLFEVDENSLVVIPNHSDDWIFNYPAPQGEIKYTEKCDVWL